jgi:hypothetical protein
VINSLGFTYRVESYSVEHYIDKNVFAGACSVRSLGWVQMFVDRPIQRDPSVVGRPVGGIIACGAMVSHLYR